MLHAQALLLLAAIAGTVTGASVPLPRSEVEGYTIPDQGDGVFTASFGPNGTLVDVTRHDVASIAQDQGAALSARGLPVSRHACNSPSSNRGDWAQAEREFKAPCTAGVQIPSHGIMYQTAGNHVAFGCSWGSRNPCSESEYSQALAYLTHHCGTYVGGWLDMDDWKKQYGMEQRGERVCGRAAEIQWK
jgi:hypothetical protein